MSIRLNGSTSGYVEIDAPAVAGSTSITLPATSGGEVVVTDSSGNIDLGPLDINGSAADDSVNIDASGRLLVGTSTARSNVYIGGGAATPTQQIETSGNTYSNGLSLLHYSSAGYCPILTLGSSQSSTPGTNALLTNGTDIGLINFVGNDGTNFRSGAYIQATVDGTSGSGDLPTRLVFSTTADGASSPTERMRIGNAGKIQIIGSSYLRFDPAAATNGTYLQFTSSQFRIGNDSGGSGNYVYLSAGATSWSGSSDERLKTDLVPIEDGLNKVGTLRAVTGRFLDDEQGTSRSFLIAQDVQSVLPEAVDDSNPDQLGLAYTDVIPLLVAALKESKERIETLEAKVAALEGGQP